MSWAAIRSHEGDYISLDGSTGKIYKGDIKTVEASVGGNFGRIMALGRSVPQAAGAHERGYSY